MRTEPSTAQWSFGAARATWPLRDPSSAGCAVPTVAVLSYVRTARSACRRCVWTSGFSSTSLPVPDRGNRGAASASGQLRHGSRRVPLAGCPARGTRSPPAEPPSGEQTPLPPAPPPNVETSAPGQTRLGRANWWVTALPRRVAPSPTPWHLAPGALGWPTTINPARNTGAEIHGIGFCHGGGYIRAPLRRRWCGRIRHGAGAFTSTRSCGAPAALCSPLGWAIDGSARTSVVNSGADSFLFVIKRFLAWAERLSTRANPARPRSTVDRRSIMTPDSTHEADTISAMSR